MKFKTPDSLMFNFELISRSDQGNNLRNMPSKMPSNLSMWHACSYGQSKLQPYCRQSPRLLTVCPVSTDT